MIDQHYLSASCCPIAFAKHSGSPDLLGGIPATWLFAAARPPGRSLQVGIALWYEAGRHESHSSRWATLQHTPSVSTAMPNIARSRGLRGPA